MLWIHQMHSCWLSGWKSSVVTECWGALVDDSSAFIVFAHYGKNGTIKKYSVWCQNKDMVLRGGDNFALKIRNCSSFDEGKRIAEQYYQEFRDGSNPRNMGTQYISEDTTFDGPFFDT